nr:MarR family transcriptional regulator [Actinomycetota bacterium]
RGAAVSSRLASDLSVRPPSITAIVDGLVSRGLVVRSQPDGDRRKVAHDLTPAGQATLDRADIAVETRLATIAGALEEPAQTADALDGLGLWRRALLAYRSAATVGR